MRFDADIRMERGICKTFADYASNRLLELGSRTAGRDVWGTSGQDDSGLL